ncbi:beta-propeller domain-containing protein [Actinocorallia sp. A-T 12471]|uniref:beta-propeller domain-containing protein n=1 Tax=Actinocorallia sp. A-T 12471 TaxID=3089813 RepID=UPI0029D1F3E8|nr:beta-propeller domain-containing protein [Actinocorallia sp. A-T 12471]MDX6739083.1 beta-propeller domain-containing protein [Actinocorallia sp. A-T 12471]
MRRTLPLAALLLVPGLILAAASVGAPPPGKAPLVLSDYRLVSYAGCDDLLDSLRAATLPRVDAYGGVSNGYAHLDDSLARSEPGFLFREESSAQPVDALASGAQADSSGYSSTNTHTPGVDEPDEVKTDGRRVLLAADNTLLVLDARTGDVAAKIALPKGFHRGSRLLLHGDTVLVLNSVQGGYGGPAVDFIGMPGSGETHGVQVDLTKRAVVSELKVRGALVDARQVGSTVRLVLSGMPRLDLPEPKERDFNNWGKAEPRLLQRNRDLVREAPLESFQPSYTVTGPDGLPLERRVPCERISHPADADGVAMTTIMSFDMSRPLSDISDSGTTSVVSGGGETVYGTADSLYVTETNSAAPIPDEPTRLSRPEPEKTRVHRFAFTGTEPRYTGSGAVPGWLLNQYSLSEHNGHLRVAVTDHAAESSSVHTLKIDGPELTTVGSVEGLGKGERIYSVRFIGDRGYVVTFKQTDPLYTLDLSDPAKPRSLGELKITGYSAYLHPTDEGRLLGIGQEATKQGRTRGFQASLFDVSGDAPTRLSQLHLPKTAAAVAEYDAHGFLYWPQTGLTVLPTWQEAVVLKVTPEKITNVGSIIHPDRDGQITRAVYIDGSVWTFSWAGVRISDAETLKREKWIPLPEQ